MRRILLYALIYGSIGAAVGVCVALYTKDVTPVPKNIVLSNGSAAKAASPPPLSAEAAEPTSQEEK